MGFHVSLGECNAEIIKVLGLLHPKLHVCGSNTVSMGQIIVSIFFSLNYPYI